MAAQRISNGFAIRVTRELWFHKENPGEPPDDTHPLTLQCNVSHMSEPARYLPRHGYTAMPWRNGAGTTREIAREPALAEIFAWRLSLATVAVSGPFSSYPGYQRVVALIGGRGFRLDIQEAPAQLLATRGEHAVFSGAAATRCELIDGPCTDLSLMVREPGGVRALTRLQIGAEQTLSSSAETIQALFVLHGAIECRALAPSQARCEPRAAAYALDFNDTLVIGGGTNSWSVRQASGDIAELLVIAFTPPSTSSL
jgi:environmental stress-induced protein Ves